MNALGSRLPELIQLHRLLEELGTRARPRVLANVTHRAIEAPIVAVTVGTPRPTAPTLVLIGGVHGLERISTQVVLAYLTTLARRLEWDRLLRDILERTRIVFVPLVNPIGMLLGRRANANGVDLMRNAPHRPDEAGTWLVGGQRWSPRLPWFMGEIGAPMETEAQALCEFVRDEIFPAKSVLLVDVHSGFGLVDRLWFPYARTRRPFPAVAETYALKQLLDRTLPNHVYKMEPQARNYTTAGDLWDHLYDEHASTARDRTFLPFTLELGSWSWVKKNPAQLLTTLGSFDPVKPHRRRRALRRHLPLFDFLHHASAAHEAWVPTSVEHRRALESEAFLLWYAQ